jgi:uncharacterized protein (TIGR02466 family)
MTTATIPAPAEKKFDVSVNALDFFATRIWSFNLPALQAHYEGWIQKIMLMRANAPTAVGRSIRAGWNSEKTIFADPAFNPLQEVALACLQHAFREMVAPPGLNFFIEAWVNMHEPGGFNTMHLHPNALLSATYYLQVPDDSGAIVFRDPRLGVNLSPFEGIGVNANSEVEIQPKAGTLLIFPNWLEHRVEINKGVNTRIAIGMNALGAVPAAKSRPL